jgi:UDP-glucose 4-epimerase
MNVLVTGGAGYIGSHAALRLLDLGHAVTVVDDLSRGNRGAVEVLARHGDFQFVESDLAALAPIEDAMRRRKIDLVMHFAALAYVGESVEQPLRYWRVNVGGILSLLEAMASCGVDRLVFSSSCATYGEPDAREIPIRETCPQRPVNPYGRTKLAGEQIIHDHMGAAGRSQAFGAVILRYFNVAGCDPRGRLGEDHRPETHLVPICLEAALRQRPGVTIFGTDYDTPDGTCIRDYVHVDDLAEAHVLAMGALRAGRAEAYNVGIGRGSSVREVVDACRRVTGVDFPVTEGRRRPGDPPALYADAARVGRELSFRPQFTGLEQTIATAWAWKKAHPRGYGTA